MLLLGGKKPTAANSKSTAAATAHAHGGSGGSRHIYWEGGRTSWTRIDNASGTVVLLEPLDGHGAVGAAGGVVRALQSGAYALMIVWVWGPII